MATANQGEEEAERDLSALYFSFEYYDLLYKFEKLFTESKKPNVEVVKNVLLDGGLSTSSDTVVQFGMEDNEIPVKFLTTKESLLHRSPQISVDEQQGRFEQFNFLKSLGLVGLQRSQNNTNKIAENQSDQYTNETELIDHEHDDPEDIWTVENLFPELSKTKLIEHEHEDPEEIWTVENLFPELNKTGTRKLKKSVQNQVKSTFVKSRRKPIRKRFTVKKKKKLDKEKNHCAMTFMNMYESFDQQLTEKGYNEVEESNRFSNDQPDPTTSPTSTAKEHSYHCDTETKETSTVYESICVQHDDLRELLKFGDKLLNTAEVGCSIEISSEGDNYNLQIVKKNGDLFEKSKEDLQEIKEFDFENFLNDISDENQMKESPEADLKNTDMPNVIYSLDEIPGFSSEENPWCDVGVFARTSCVVQSYFEPSEGQENEHELISTSNLPNFSLQTKISLIEPDCTYRFRVASVNADGRGPWSEPATFSTFPIILGRPGCVSSVKFLINNQSLKMFWDPPDGEVINYTVELAFQAKNEQGYVYKKVYKGVETCATVSFSTLARCYINKTASHNEIFFQITARNQYGDGPALRIKWRQ